MSREGRSQPIQPFASHGFLGNVPANGTLPRVAVVVENDDRRRRTPPLQPVIISAAYSAFAAPVVFPPGPQFVAEPIRAKAANPVQPVVEHGFLGNTPANGTTPPPVVNVDRVDQRGRYRPLDPIALSAALLGITPPAALPTGPFVVPLDERRRFLAQLPPTILHGADDPDPPLPNVVEPERRRRVSIDPTIISGALASLIGPFVAPPEPQSVEPAALQRRRLTPDPLSISGALIAFFGPFVAPPAALVVSATDDGKRRVVPQPISISGVLAPFFPVLVAPPAPLVVVGEDGRRRLVPQPIVLAGREFPAAVVAIVVGAFDPAQPHGGADGHAATTAGFDASEPSGGADGRVPAAAGYDSSQPGVSS